MSVSDRILRWSTVSPVQPARRRLHAEAGSQRRPSWLARLLRRRELTTYQRCLAVHIHFAGPRSALS